MKKKNRTVSTWVTPEEEEKLKQRMADAGVRNVSAFIRKMMFDGYIVLLDLQTIREMIVTLRGFSDRLEQIAEMRETDDPALRAGIEEIQAKQEEIWSLVRELLGNLSTIK